MSWKGYVSDIRKDKTGRFKYLPSVSHGQLLFMQHLISKMAHMGSAWSFTTTRPCFQEMQETVKAIFANGCWIMILWKP